MKKVAQDNWMEEIVRYWGSLEAYNEEQRRCGLMGIEAQANSQPTQHKITLDEPDTIRQSTPVRSRSRARLSLNLFSSKA